MLDSIMSRSISFSSIEFDNGGELMVVTISCDRMIVVFVMKFDVY